MFRKNKQNLESNEDAQCLAIINTFIANSRKQLDVLSSLSLEKKKKLTLDIANITKVSVKIIQIRELQIFSTHIEIEECNFKITTLMKELENLQTSKVKLVQRVIKKRKISREISILQEKIISLFTSISSYNSEVFTYQKALDICCEFSRRLKFFLEYEENFSS